MPLSRKYMTSDKDRMFLYVWHSEFSPEECKLGERFVFAGIDPQADCLNRVRQSVGVTRYFFEDGLYVLDAIWDVSDWASEVGRNHQNAKMDDYVRAFIGYRKYPRGEFHTITASEMIRHVDSLIQRRKQPLPTVGLSPWQYEQATNVINAINSGRKTILAELCARFGKTLWASAVSLELGKRVTIVASYVLTAFTSFSNEITGYEQFRNHVIVDSSSPDYRQRIATVLRQGLNVVVFVSMCNSASRDNRIRYLFRLPVTKILFVDEADYGTHTPNQTEPLMRERKASVPVILMSGTNADRASSYWNIDHYTSVMYLELLMEKQEVNY